MGSQIGAMGTNSSNGGGGPIKKVLTDSGPGAAPLAGVVNVVGGSNVTTVDSSNNAVIRLDDDITITEATIGNINIQSNTISTANATTDITLDPDGLGNVILDNQSAGGQLYNDASFNVKSDTLVDGAVLIGSSSGAPAANTLTAGAGVTITNAPGSITIASAGSGSGSGFGFPSWEKISFGAQPGESPYLDVDMNKGYIVNSYGRVNNVFYPAIVTLPDSSSVSFGDSIAILAIGGSHVAIQPRADQYIRYSQNVDVAATLNLALQNSYVDSTQVLVTPPQGSPKDSYYRIFAEALWLVCVKIENGYTVFAPVSISAVWTKNTLGSGELQIWDG